MIFLVLISFFFSICFSDDSFDFVTCGSVIKLENKKLGYKLHSQELKIAFENIEQIVTGFEADRDSNSYWQVYDNSKDCQSDKPIRCQSDIRLVHLNTKMILNSSSSESLMSNQQEVSCVRPDFTYHQNAEWKLECSGFWKRGATIKLKNLQTNQWLSMGTNRYRYPIANQLEVYCERKKNSNNDWIVKKGIFFQTDQKKEKSEF